MIFSTKGKLKLSPFAAYPDNQFGQLKKIYKKNGFIARQNFSGQLQYSRKIN
jgi:hypothetical protein